MSFGPATFGLRQAIQVLLQGQKPSQIAPVPLAPTGGIGPLDLETTAALAALQPEPVPPQLPGPVDADAIRARYAALAGPEPVAPQAGPDPLILKIARALQGFGAGVQGQGPQFLAQLREQRERPQREFQAKKERFETRRQELGVMAEQEVGRAQGRTEERTQELLDKQFQREFSEGVRKLNLRDQREQDLFRDTLLAKRQREEDERQAEENRRKEEAQKIRDARTFAREYRKAGAGKFAKELADFDAGITSELSAAAEKWESAQVRLQQIRADRAARGASGTRQPKVMVEIANPDGSTSVVPLTAQVSSGLTAGTITQGPRGVFIEGQQAQTRPAPSISTMPIGFPEFSGGLQQAPAAAAAAAKPGTVFTRAEVEAHAKRARRDPKAVEADIRARGGIVQ